MQQEIATATIDLFGYSRAALMLNFSLFYLIVSAEILYKLYRIADEGKYKLTKESREMHIRLIVFDIVALVASVSLPFIVDQEIAILLTALTFITVLINHLYGTLNGIYKKQIYKEKDDKPNITKKENTEK